MSKGLERGGGTLARLAEIGALALVAYVPFLRSSPHQVSSDSKQALYVDPGRFLADAAHLWDPSVGMGTVPHQHIGYLWPMGPWFWAFDLIGAPDWIAQRLWLGSLTFAAALGARWLVRSLGLGRSAAFAAALVYALTPYQLAFTARTSVLLLPWAGLPWLVELTRRAVRHGGWRHPALFALVVVTTAGVNAPAVLLVGVAPLAVLVIAAIVRPGTWRASGAAALRIGALTLPACAFWLAGLRVQGAYGMPVLQLTENLRTTSEWSSPDDVLRALGNWFFYGYDRSGFSLDQTDAYLNDEWFRPLSYLVGASALFAAAVVRWQHRVLTVVLLLVGTVVAVGSWPYLDPSPIGRLMRFVIEGASAGAAFRNSARIIPVLVLAMALALAAGIAALGRRGRIAAGATVAAFAVVGLAPVTERGMLSTGVERPEELPGYWLEAAQHLDAAGDDTRVLELPGANFAAYRWGNAIEPITPLLIDRPYLAREVLPSGTPASALLLDALDRRLQTGVLDPESVVPVARLLGVGDIVVRSDLAHERFELVRPDQVWEDLVDPRAPGLAPPVDFGEPTANAGMPGLTPFGPDDLRPGRTVDRTTSLPPVAVLGVDDPQLIVRTGPADAPIVLAGDADGIVDAAAQAVLDGRTPVLLSAALDDDELADAADRGAYLVLTDGNRRRPQSWFASLRDTRGATEEAGKTDPDEFGYDARLDAFADAGPGLGDGARTVVDQVGGEVHATADGGIARPEDRAAAAVDGRLSTAWRVGGADPTGAILTVEPDDPQELDHITVVQPEGPRDRVLTRVRVTVGDDEPFDVELGPDSLTPEGQVVSFPRQQVDRVQLELLETTTPPFDPKVANAVGFAEVRVGDLQVEETVRLPDDLLGRLDGADDGLPLDVVLTRLRTDPDRWQRDDEEAFLDRSFVLPSDRTFALTGTARISDDADDPTVDELLGTLGDVRFTSSSRLQGSPGSRASRAFDGDPSTAWTSAFGELTDPWLEVDPTSIQGDELIVDLLTDERHATPGTIVAELDGQEVGRQSVAAGQTRVAVPLDSTDGERLRLRFEDRTPGDLPVSVTEVGGLDLPEQPAGEPSDACRDDLVIFDDHAQPVRLTPIEGSDAFTVTGCEDLAAPAGGHRLRTALGEDAGVSIDALRLASGDQTERPASPATVKTTSTDRTRVTATVDTDGSPFWFVPGQSTSPGWTLDVEGGSAGARTLVDGATDGWLITPDQAGEMTLTATWTPQRTIWVALAISALAIIAALAIVASTHRATALAPVARPRLIGSGEPRGSVAGIILAAAVAGLLGAIIARPITGAAMAVGAAVVVRWPRTAWVVAALAPLTLAASRIVTQPELGWLALGWVVAVTVADVIRRRSPAPP